MTPPLLTLALLVVAQQDPSATSIAAEARSGRQTQLIASAQKAPGAAREAVRNLLQAAPSAGGSEPLRHARAVAAAYEAAWQDSFLIREVARFESWTPAEQRRKLTVDSLRLAGNRAFADRGVTPAVTLWRLSAREAAALADTAGLAAALGNIGAAFYSTGDLDSATTYLGMARDFGKAAGDLRTWGNAVGALANISRDRGELRVASTLYASSAELRRRSGDTGGMAADRNNLGEVAQQLGDFTGARVSFEAALALNRRLGRLDAAALNLINLGNLASLQGNYDEAQARYQEALEACGKANHLGCRALARYNLGQLALRRGDYAEAVRALDSAVAGFRAAGLEADRVAAQRILAEALAALGDFERARSVLTEAETTARRAPLDPFELAGLAIARADLALQLNDLVEADREYGQADQLYLQAGDPVARAEAMQGRAVLLMQREEFTGARELLVAALRLQDAAGDPRPAALSRLQLGYAEHRLGDSAAARATLGAARDSLHALGDPVGTAAALGLLADLDVDAGLFLSGEATYREALALLGGRPAPTVAWWLHLGLGNALRGRGAPAEAAAELRLAAAEVEQVARPIALEDRRAEYRADKWEVYAQLALVERARGRTASAFEASERLRARQMLDLLERGRLTFQEAADDSLASREQDLRRRISELTREVEGSSWSIAGLRGPAPSDSASAAAREALAAAQQSYAELLREVRERRPDYASLVHGAVPSTREVMARLDPDQVLIEYLLTDSAVVAFVITRDTTAAVTLDVGRQDLVTLVDLVRGTLVQPDRPESEQFWRTALRRLYRYLITPVEDEGWLRGRSRLLIAPHGELHYLPFPALIGGPRGGYLIERYDVSYVPSAAVWLRLAQRPQSAPRAGVLALAPHPRRLPGSRQEMVAISRLYGDRARVLVGTRATERAVRDASASAGVVHLATYGVLNKHNPLFSFVELAAEGEDDGRLEVHEVFSLGLQARVVVLSACQTGLASGTLTDIPAGDDWVGLVRAFLFAGANSVLATLWPVEDGATAMVMEQFHTRLTAGDDLATAVARAQRGMLGNPATAHPFYWAGLALVGGAEPRRTP